MSKNIVLVGFMGSGKTTISKLIAEITGRELLDTDALIENKVQKKIKEIFKLYGEDFFRELEMSVIKEISDFQDKIISTGGGCLEWGDNLENLKKNSILFYLRTDFDVLFDRINDDSDRPLVRKLKAFKKTFRTLKKLFEKREPFYKQANEIIVTKEKEPDTIANEIIEKYQIYE